MQPSDSLPPSATAPVPLARGLPRCRRLFYAPRRADDTCARTRVVRRRRVTGAPRHRDWSRRGEGLPGYGTVLFICAMVEHPAGAPPPRPDDTYAKGCCCLQVNQDPRPPGRLEVSGPHVPWPTCSHAYASPTPFLGSSPGLLPAQAGSPLAGRVLHPLDGRRSFLKLSHPHSPSTRIAWSHWYS